MFNFSFDTRQFESDLTACADKVASSLEATLKESATEIANDTNRDDSSIPVVANSTVVNKVDSGYLIEKGAGMATPELAAYSEFGTGNFAAVLLAHYPEDWKNMARQYYINGKGRLPASPSLYNAFVKNTMNIAEKVVEKIEK